MKYDLKESSTVELKAKMPENGQIIKTIIGFCNANGGKLILGVGDDGTILGVSNKAIEHALESLDQAIYQACSPPIIPQVYTQSVGDKTLLIISVSAGMMPPYYQTSEGRNRGTYIRLGRSTVRANIEMIQDLELRSRGISYDTTPVYGASEEQLDRDQLRHFFKQRRRETSPKLTDHLLHSFHLIRDEHGQRYPTVAGMLLFGRDPQLYFSEAMIICTHFHGTEGREVIATKDCAGTLFEQLSTACDWVWSRLNRSFTIKGLKREEQLELPEEALREVIVNAIIHRNYHIKAPNKIAIYANRVEVFSPGNFPGPIDDHELKLGLSFIRNVAITKTFREAGYIEKMGSGLLTLFNSFKKRQLSPPILTEGASFVKVTLPRTHEIGEEVDEILHLFSAAGEISVSDVIRHLRISRATASRRLSRLVEKGYIQRVGKGAATRYKKSS